MAQIDLSNGPLASVMLCSTFTVLRRVQVVNTLGESTNPNTQSIPGVPGVVTSATPDDLARHPEIEMTSKAISITTSFPLRSVFSQSSGTNQYLPDIVIWNGSNFVVRAVDDYSTYGPGFINAIATGIDSVDSPPTSIVPS